MCGRIGLSGWDAPPVLEPAEKALDEVGAAIGALGAGGGLLWPLRQGIQGSIVRPVTATHLSAQTCLSVSRMVMARAI